jgi:hypothetical protein
MILEKETTAGEETNTRQQACKTCGHAFAGRYCNQCGEKVIEPRDLSVRHYLEDIFNAFTSLDGKVWRTIRLVAQVPGGLSRAYMEGRRSPYLKPVSIFFLANVIYFLLPFFETFNSRLETQLSGRPHSRIANRLVDDYIWEKNITMPVFRERYEARSTENAKLLLIVLVFLISVPLGVGKYRQATLRGRAHYAGLRNHELQPAIQRHCPRRGGLRNFLRGQMAGNRRGDYPHQHPGEPACVRTNGYFLYRAERTFYGCAPRESLWRMALVVPCLFAALGAYRTILFFVTFYSLP